MLTLNPTAGRSGNAKAPVAEGSWTWSLPEFAELCGQSEAHGRSVSCCSNAARCPPYASPCVDYFGFGSPHPTPMEAPAAPSASSFWLIHLKENFVLGGNTLPSGRDTLPPGDLLPSAVRLCRQRGRLHQANKNKQKKTPTLNYVSATAE